MSFYKEIQPYIDYIASIRKLDNYLSFDVVFPNKWVIPKSIVEGYCQTVPFEPGQEGKNGVSFVVEKNEKNVDLVTTVIDKIIKLNKEKELKEELFRKMVGELKSVFEKNSLDKLYTLSFHIGEDDTPEEELYDKVEEYEPGEVTEMVRG